MSEEEYKKLVLACSHAISGYLISGSGKQLIEGSSNIFIPSSQLRYAEEYLRAIFFEEFKKEYLEEQ